VNVGHPLWKVDSNGNKVKEEKLSVNNKQFVFTRVNFGNPHAVIFVDDFNFNYPEIGNSISNNTDLFPNKVNVEFVQIVNDHEINFRFVAHSRQTKYAEYGKEALERLWHAALGLVQL
jgi:diaminopimelate epimerase